MGDPPSKSAFSEEEEQEDPLVALGKGLVPAGYLRQGLEAGLGRRRAALRRLLEHRRLPEDGWDDAAIEGVLYDLAMMDRWEDGCCCFLGSWWGSGCPQCMNGYCFLRTKSID